MMFPAEKRVGWKTMESVIAEKYAVALLQVAQEQKTVDAIGAEIQSIQKMVETNADLRNTLEHPRVKADEKLSALQGFLGQKLSTTMENFLLLLIVKKRIKHLKAVADHYERLLYGMQGKAVARVLTAMPLTAAQKQSHDRKALRNVRSDGGIKGRSEAQPDRRNDDLFGRPANGRKRAGPTGTHETTAFESRNRVNEIAEVIAWQFKRMK